MKRIGIFGGSFNPIHNGHVALAAYILRAAGLHEVWFMVSPLNPLKQQANLLSDKLRLDLVRKTLKQYDGLVASDIEFGLPKPSYTWQTLQWLAKNKPQYQFVLLIGADNWLSFTKWFRHEEILEKHEIIIYPRQSCTIDTTLLPTNVRLLDMPLNPISSTMIREKVKNSEPIDGLVPNEILEEVEKLY